MYTLNVNKKTGFVCHSDALVITTPDGNLFYFRERKNKSFSFNLPKGAYFVNCKIDELQKPVSFRHIKLAKPNMLTPLPSKFKIIYTENPNKCSVDMNKGIIYFDNEYLNYPKYYIDYILFHELGHYRYRNGLSRSKHVENNCDAYADRCMLIEGYNLSQIRAASKFVLSNSSEAVWRKKQQLKRLKIINNGLRKRSN